MKPIIIALTAVLLACGVTYGQGEPGPNFEHLKCYGPMLGTWRYEGPLLEDLPDIAEKGTKCVFQFSWRRILNKNVVEENWSVEFEGGERLEGKALIGWNAAKELTYGGMNSFGGMSLGTVTFDADARSSTLTETGIDGDGKDMKFKAVVKKTGKDTLTWQALERVGDIVEGPTRNMRSRESNGSSVQRWPGNVGQDAPASCYLEAWPGSLPGNVRFVKPKGYQSIIFNAMRGMYG